MTYNDANYAISMHLTGEDGIGTKPMIVYALDTEFLPEEVYQQICGFQEKGNILNGYPWVMGLYWIRRFYELGSGNNYLSLLGNNEVAKQIFKKWEIGNYPYNPNREDFLTQCPLLLAEVAGPSSELTRGIRLLAKDLDPNFSDHDFSQQCINLIDKLYSGNDLQITFSKAQINSIDKYPSYFRDLIRALLTGEGSGWLAKIAEHPLQAELARPRWGILSNGQATTLALQLRTRISQISIGQGDYTHVVRPYQNVGFVKANELVAAGFELTKPLTLAGRTLEIPELNTPRLARVSPSSAFHPFLDLDREEIQTAEIWVLSPGSEQLTFTYDNVNVNFQAYPIGGLNQHRLIKIDLRQLDRSTPRSLCLNDLPLIRVGASSWIDIPEKDESVAFHDDAEIGVIFGNHCELRLEDFYGDQVGVQWNGCTVEPDGRVMMHPNVMGQPCSAAATIPGRDTIRVKLRFLPSELRDVILNEENCVCETFRYEPNAEKRWARIESSQRCPGNLWINGICERISVASLKPHYRLLRSDVLLSEDQPLSLSGLDDTRSISIQCYLPPGTNQISWGGLSVVEIKEIKGPAYWREYLRNLPTADGGTELRLQILMENGETIEPCVLSRLPQLIPAENGTLLQLPVNFEAENWEYALLREGSVGALIDSGRCQYLQRNQGNDSVCELQLPCLAANQDQGVNLLLWDKTIHPNIGINTQSPFDVWNNAKPMTGILGPFILQYSNPFRTWSAFHDELNQAGNEEIRLPAWLRTDWGNKYDPPLDHGVPVLGSFLKTDFTLIDLAGQLNGQLLHGDNWLAKSCWGGANLAQTLKKVENAYLEGSIRMNKPNFAWSHLKGLCLVLSEFVKIRTGKKPDLIWLPDESLRFGFGSYLQGCHRLLKLTKTEYDVTGYLQYENKLKFNYGESTKTRTETPKKTQSQWQDLAWDFPTINNAGKNIPPPWWPGVGIILDCQTDQWGRAAAAFRDLFQRTLLQSSSIIGTFPNKRLAFVFLNLRDWMEHDGFSATRILLFEAAVVCRLRAWCDAQVPERDKDILQNLVASAWGIPEFRDILTRDLLTVDWAIAWLHEPIED